MQQAYRLNDTNLSGYYEEQNYRLVKKLNKKPIQAYTNINMLIQ